jgi:hypothetical protein
MTVNKQEQQLTHLQCIQKNHMHDFSKLLFPLSTILHPSLGQQETPVPLLDFGWGEVMDELCITSVKKEQVKIGGKLTKFETALHPLGWQEVTEIMHLVRERQKRGQSLMLGTLNDKAEAFWWWM